MFTPTQPGEILAIEPFDVYFNEISIIPSYSCGPNDTRQALDLFAREIINAEDFITHRYSVAEAPQAFKGMAAMGDVIKAVVEFD